MKTKYHHGDLKVGLIKTGLKMIQENEIEKENYFNSGIHDNAMHTLGVGTTRNMKPVITGIFFPSLRMTDYPLKERIHIWRGKPSRIKPCRIFLHLMRVKP